VRESNRWHTCFLDQDFRKKLRREMAEVTGRFTPEPKCRWCRDTGRVRDPRLGTFSDCPHCRKSTE